MHLNIEKKYHSVLLLGVFFLIVSLLLFGYNSYDYFKVTKQEEIRIDNFLSNVISDGNIIVSDDADNERQINNEQSNEISSDEYVLVLEIPDINLKKGLVDIASKYNDVKYNIQIIDESNYPNIENGNLILAAHNGSDYYAYFRNLSKLKVGNSVYVYYEGLKYHYILDKIYDIKKDGSAEIKRDVDKTTITLITCKDNTDDMQVVYIGYLSEKTSYN